MRAHLFILFLFFFSFTASAQTDSVILEPVRIDKIIIEGNNRTHSYIIRRELPFAEGDTLTRGAWEAGRRLAVQQLLNTRLFNDVVVTDSVSSGQSIVRITVDERWYIWPDLSVGQVPRDFREKWHDRFFERIYGTLELSHYNLTGRNDRMTAGVTAGWKSGAAIKYELPFVNRSKTWGFATNLYFFQGRRLGFGVDSNLQTFIYLPPGNRLYSEAMAEGAILLRKRLRLQHRLGVAWQGYYVDDTLAKTLNPAYLSSEQNRFQALRFGYGLMYDNRDFYFYPTKGNYVKAAVYLHTPILGSTRPFFTSDITLRQYIPIVKRLGFAGELSWHGSFSQEIPPFVYQPKLWTQWTVRGYQRYYIYGRHAALARTELRFNWLDWKYTLPRFPIKQLATVPIKSYIKVFADGGRTLSSTDDLTLGNEWLGSVGIGLDTYTYHDKIVRLELAFPRHGSYLFWLGLVSLF